MSTGGVGTDVPVGPDNWQLPPVNRRAYWHVKEIVPTQLIARGDGPVRRLAVGSQPRELSEIGLTHPDGSVMTVGQVLAETYTDAYVVLQDGEVVAEGYGPEGGPDRTHALMSISKSVVGCVAAALIDRELLDDCRLVTDYVPELGVSGYAGATVRNVIDMRSGVRFREDYGDPAAEVWVLGQWIHCSAGDHRGLYGFLVGLGAEAPHGQRFLYRSAETDVLGWVCERAADRPMAELISILIWQPVGAEYDAEIICDGQGTAVHDGGLCATARDVARFGQMLLDNGSVPDRTAAVIPPGWLRQAWAVDADARAVFAASPGELSMPGGWYRNQFWFYPGRVGDVLLCLGINGQMVYVSRRTRTVCVKLSSWPQPQQPSYLANTLWAFDAVAATLTGRSVSHDRHPLPGIAAGLSRHRGADRSES